jgi:hypothetical protein
MSTESTLHFDLDVRVVGHNLETEQMVSLALSLNKILSEIKSCGINKDTARLIKTISPDAAIPSLEHYTVLPTVTNLTVSVESVGSELIKIIREIIAKGQALIMQFLEWIKSKFTDKKSTHDKIVKHTQKLLAVKKFESEIAPLVDLEVQTEVESHPQVVQTANKIESTYSKLVEHLTKSPKYVNVCYHLLNHKYTLLEVAKLVIDHYKKLIQDPIQALDSVVVNVDSPTIHLNGIQSTLDGLLVSIDRDLTQLVKDVPAPTDDDRPTEHTLNLLSALLTTIKDMHQQSATMSDSDIMANTQNISKLASIADKLMDPRESELEQDLKGLLAQVKQLVQTPIRLPDDMDSNIRRGLIRQAQLHQLYINELLHIVSKIDTLTKYILDVLAAHTKAIAMAAVAEAKVTAQVIKPKARTEEQQRALADKIDAFLNGEIDGFTDKP